MAHVLIIDDDELVCHSLEALIERLDQTADHAHTLREGLKKASSQDFDVVFLDVRLPDGNGLDILPQLQVLPSKPEIIILTGFGDQQGAELALKNRVWDYIEKPPDLKQMKLLISRVVEYRKEKKIARTALDFKGLHIVGTSPQMNRCYDLVFQAAQSDASVLLTGETGTGKELFAHAIHKLGPRAQKHFVVVDCTALPSTLVDSILFGHEKGAFTGAEKSQDGLIKQAHEGTLFLDEIGELPLTIQKSFLRVLQEKRFRPLGSSREINSNFRLIAATNRDLDKMVENEEFREDLFFRIRSLHIELPPLRDRRADITDLVVSYLTQLGTHYGTGTKGISAEFWDMLRTYHWPGNVRELFQALESAHAAAFDEATLVPKHLPPHIRIALSQTSLKYGNADSNDEQTMECPSAPPQHASERMTSLQEIRKNAVAEVEKKYLEELIERTNGNVSEICRIAELSKSRLYTLLKMHDIKL